MTAEAPVRSGAGALRAGIVGAMGLLIAVTGIAVPLAGDIPFDVLLDNYAITNLVIGAAVLVCGCVIVGARPANSVGVLFVIAGLGHLTSAAAFPIAFLGDRDGWPELAVRAAMTLFMVGWLLGLGGLFPVALLLFPDGRLPSPAWRLAMIALFALPALQLGVTLVNATPTTGLIVTTPLTAIVEIPESVVATVGLASSAAALLSVAALVVRYVRGDDRMRRQLLWLVLAVLAALALNAERWITGDGPVPLLLGFLLVPVAVVIAIVRHQLFDIRFVVSRAIAYGVLVVLVVTLYVGIVAGVSLLVPPESGRVVAIGAALVIAFAFAPLRTLLLSLLTRTFYGSRGDPVSTAWLVGSELGPDSELGDLLERLRGTLRLRGLELRRKDASPVTAGDVEGMVAVVPVSSGAELAAGLRRGESRLHADDERILALVGAPIALLAHTLDLTDQLRDARAATVEARERERAVLHRDLHDGLGPTLTSAAYRAEAARNLIPRDAARASVTIADAERDVRAALAEVRRVVYGLRPLELEERGLWGALEHLTAQFRRIAVEVRLPAARPVLSPAVEVAAYRIVGEALVNADRHSNGSHAVLTARLTTDELWLEVTDDGAPEPGFRSGVGIASMRERAEELGGEATLGPGADGWRVAVRLPLR